MRSGQRRPRNFAGSTPIFGAWVLNALRHQRGAHLVYLRDRALLGRVLNALRHQRGSHNQATDERLVVSRVLNALWHQRGAHLGFQSGNPRLRGVLNALRHQRGLHPLGTPQSKASSMCSTPCGIKEACTNTALSNIGLACSCSTPCGIKEERTGLRSGLRCGRRTCAQRLAASKRIAQCWMTL